MTEPTPVQPAVSVRISPSPPVRRTPTFPRLAVRRIRLDAGVPNAAGVADTEIGFLIRVGGKENVIGGISAVAPLWAGLIALFNEQLGRNGGWLNRTLCGAIAQQKALHDIVSGTNGNFKAAASWDACTGLGTLDGQAISKLLRQKTK